MLQKLDITKNDVRELPAQLGDLHKLECLYAQHNDISEMPSFAGCAALREILIANNYLKVMMIILVKFKLQPEIITLFTPSGNTHRFL